VKNLLTATIACRILKAIFLGGKCMAKTSMGLEENIAGLSNTMDLPFAR
jgi:hypothetical protein